MVNESVDIKYTQFTDWNTGFQGSIEVTNNSKSSIQDWDLDFDLPREINDIWGARIVSSSNGDYTVESLDWNREIRPGQTINIGFIGEGDGVTPQNFDLEGEGENQPAEDGDRINFNRESDNRFVLSGGYPIKGVQDVEVTDIFDQQSILEDINLTSGDGTVEITGEQFASI